MRPSPALNHISQVPPSRLISLDTTFQLPYDILTSLRYRYFLPTFTRPHDNPVPLRHFNVPTTAFSLAVLRSIYLTIFYAFCDSSCRVTC
jgi:hypothetical protein